MRTTLFGDLVAAARVLLTVSPGECHALIDRMLAEAHIAHIYYKRVGRPHARWGNGSLFGRAALMPQLREPFASDPAFLVALCTVIEGLLRRAYELDVRGTRRTVEMQTAVV